MQNAQVIVAAQGGAPLIFGSSFDHDEESLKRQIDNIKFARAAIESAAGQCIRGNQRDIIYVAIVPLIPGGSVQRLRSLHRERGGAASETAVVLPRCCAVVLPRCCAAAMSHCLAASLRHCRTSVASPLAPPPRSVYRWACADGASTPRCGRGYDRATPSTST